MNINIYPKYMRLDFLVLPSMNTNILALGNPENGHEEVQSAKVLETTSEIQNLIKNLEKLGSFNQTNLDGEKCTSLLTSVVKMVCTFIPKGKFDCSALGTSLVGLICPFVPWYPLSGE